MRTISTLFISLILMSCASSGGVDSSLYPPSQIELFGNLIGQYEDVGNKTLGEPDEVRRTRDDWQYSFHILNEIGRERNYVVFKYPPASQFRQAYSVQIAGEPYPNMPAFLGLHLGDTEAMVLAKFGKPSKKKHFKDDYVEVNVWQYKNRNYSFEFDMQGRLYSIQIFGYRGFKDPNLDDLDPQFHGMRKAVLSKDGESLMLNYIAPDVEFYHQGEAIRYKTSPRIEMTKGKGKMFDYVLGEQTSLLMFFKLEPDSKPEVAMRRTESGRAFMVYKFPDSQIVEEIVFTYHGGQWKVYEVAFHDVNPV